MSKNIKRFIRSNSRRGFQDQQPYGGHVIHQTVLPSKYIHDNHHDNYLNDFSSEDEDDSLTFEREEIKDSKDNKKLNKKSRYQLDRNNNSLDRQSRRVSQSVYYTPPQSAGRSQTNYRRRSDSRKSEPRTAPVIKHIPKKKTSRLGRIGKGIRNIVACGRRRNSDKGPYSPPSEFIPTTPRTLAKLEKKRLRHKPKDYRYSEKNPFFMRYYKENEYDDDVFQKPKRK